MKRELFQKQATVILCSLWLVILQPRMALAEWYVAGQVGFNFADGLRNIRGTGSLAGLEAPDFDIKNSLAYGGKVGFFPFHGAIGLELDVFHSSPHIKNLDDVPGIHLSVTDVGVNLILRYPGLTWQPYLGGGPALLISRLGGSQTTQRDTDVAIGGNVLAGLRTFLTPNIAVFSEYKYTDAKFRFDGAFGSAGGFDGTYRAHQVFVGLSYHF